MSMEDTEAAMEVEVEVEAEEEEAAETVDVGKHATGTSTRAKSGDNLELFLVRAVDFDVEHLVGAHELRPPHVWDPISGTWRLRPPPQIYVGVVKDEKARGSRGVRKKRKSLTEIDSPSAKRVAASASGRAGLTGEPAISAAQFGIGARRRGSDGHEWEVDLGPAGHMWVPRVVASPRGSKRRKRSSPEHVHPDGIAFDDGSEEQQKPLEGVRWRAEAAAMPCEKSPLCTRPNKHTGRCNRKKAMEEEAAETVEEGAVEAMEEGAAETVEEGAAETVEEGAEAAARYEATAAPAPAAAAKQEAVGLEEEELKLQLAAEHELKNDQAAHTANKN